jgi:hypothetical protein
MKSANGLAAAEALGKATTAPTGATTDTPPILTAALADAVWGTPPTSRLNTRLAAAGMSGAATDRSLPLIDLDAAAATAPVRESDVEEGETALGFAGPTPRAPRTAVRTAPADTDPPDAPADTDAPDDPEVSANANGIAATAEPTPSAVAKAPTRPTYRAYPVAAGSTADTDRRRYSIVRMRPGAVRRC